MSAARQSRPVYPDDYRKCSQVCGAALGQPCYSRSGKVVDGRPDGVKTVLDRAHKARKIRTGKKA